MDLQELSDKIGTLELAKSEVNGFLGNNTRMPSLVPGAMYILKKWTIKDQLNSDNPYSVARFVGSGRETEDGRMLNKENPAINKMQNGDYYFFEAVDGKGEAYVFGAYMFNSCICIGSGAVRITCYIIRGHEPDGEAATAPAKPRVAVAKPASSVAKRPTTVRRTPDIDREDQPIEELDENMPVPGTWQCHPISMRPMRKLS